MLPTHHRLYILCLLSLLTPVLTIAQTGNREFYELKIYTIKDKEQEEQVDYFLQNAFIPGLHAVGIQPIGVFKPLETDSTFGKRIFVLIPYRSLDDVLKITSKLYSSPTFNEQGKKYLDAVYSNPPYVRIESIILRAFVGMKKMEAPAFNTSRTERIYELRSYESATERIYQNKVRMFNEGDEISLFKRLGFNAVFYADVIAGSRMPNLMYMTSFASQTSHDEHWKSFIEDPSWKKLSSMPEYQHNISKMNIYLMRPTPYSDY